MVYTLKYQEESLIKRSVWFSEGENDRWPQQFKEHGVKSGWKQEKEKQAGWKSLSWELQERRYLYMPEFASSHPPYHNPGKTLTYILKIEKGKKKKKEKKDFTLLDK